MDRVFNPPMPVSTARPYTIADLEAMKSYNTVPQRFVMGHHTDTR
jgi:hypothetical protein